MNLIGSEKIHIFGSHFITKLTSVGYSGVEDWYQKVHYFTHEVQSDYFQFHRQTSSIKI